MPTRRSFLAAAAGVGGLAGCVSLPGGGDSTPTPNPPSGPVAGAPLPADPGGYTYAQTGGADAPVVTYFGSWKCPFCADFSTGNDDRVLPLARIVTDYVEPGKVRLTYRTLAYGGDGKPFLGPDAPRAARFGLAVWQTDPGSYWPYHEYVMANQPPESKRWATLDRLAEFARIAGVSDVSSIREAVESGEYENAVRKTTEAAGRAGIRGTPSLVADGRVVSPFEPDRTRQLLDSLADG